MTRSLAALSAIAFAATLSTAALAATETSPAANSPPPTSAKAMTPATHSPAAQRMSPRRLEELQAALNTNGEKIAVDGIWGSKTADALRDFQQKHGLKASGRYDQATAQKLKLPRWS